MKKFAIMAVIVLVFSGLTQAAVSVVEYDFGPTYALRTLVPSVEADHITGGNFGYTGDSPYIGYTTGSDGTGNAYQADEGWNDDEYEDYFSFTVSIDAGWKLDISSLEFDSYVSNMSGPRYANVTCIVGPAENTIETDIDIWYSGWQTGSARNIADSYLPTGLTGDVTFRIYAKDTLMGYGGSFAVDNVILNGSVSQIPEPATMCLLGLGALGLLKKRRFR